jgi:class 3 adenylate cyclase/predicted ATPase
VNIGDWLRGLRLGQYEAAFRENDIDAEVLPELTTEDLIALGVTSIGHRRKILAAITALSAGLPDAEVRAPPADKTAQADAERRQLTVMFCDLVGSTLLSTRLDPEDLREVIAAYHHAVARTIAAFDGFVAKYMGDGVLVYFGYPQAHEDDAERAVRAGLGVIDAVGRLDVKCAELQARVGIATGLVVVGDLIGEGSAQEQSVVGETPNLAARLQTLAEPNAVIIAAGTRRLVGDLFELRDLGALDVKGIAEPIAAWWVVRPNIVASRFEALRGLALIPLVGRDEEVDLLLRRWSRAKTGEGQIMLISGEPGVGKSRILAELVERLHAEPHFALRYFCSPYYQDSALFPFIDQLGRAAEFGHDDVPGVKLLKLGAVLAHSGPPNEDMSYLADLLSLPPLEQHPLPKLSPQRKKERTLEALLRQLEGLARHQPVLVAFEDVHWIDPTSLELLDLAVERVRSLPVLLIVTFRPEFRPPWTGQARVTMLTLNRLDRRDRTALVEQIANGKSLPDEVVAQIVDRADGVPLFVEELTKSVLESGLLREEGDRYILDGALPPFAIPTTLHDSLMARLDRLASVRLVAQIGAAIGREFPYRLLRAVSGLPEDELRIALDRLVTSELVFQRGRPPDAIYAFKHVLVQDAVHGTLLRTPRRQLHARIAEALKKLSPELAESQPEILAQHYSEAELTGNSVACWLKAGQRSAARSAMAEAAAQLEKGLNKLGLLPQTRERQQRELEFYSILGMALQAVKGFAAQETGDAYARARKLWEQLGSPSAFLQIPHGQSLYHMNRGEYDLSVRLDEELLRLSRQNEDCAGLVLGHASFGRNLLLVGQLAASRSHLEEVLSLDDPISCASLVHQAGFDSSVASKAFLAIVLLCLGFPDQALALSEAAVDEARTLAHPPTLTLSLAVGAVLFSLIDDDVVLGERSDQLIELATDQGFLFWRVVGSIFRGWVKVKNRELVEGMSLLRDGSTAYRGTGARMFVPHHLALLARACAIAGQYEEGLGQLNDALQIVDRTGERWLQAELSRLKGQLLLRLGHSDAAEESYRKALTIANAQGARLLELRAAVSLARLRRDHGRRSEAGDLLAPVYGWFTEGFGTPDLKKAKALLDELV